MSNKQIPILKLFDALFYLAVILFATLWKRNWAFIFGLFLYSIYFNLQLFKNPITGWIKGIELETRFWVLGFICLCMSLVLWLLGFSKNKDFADLTKEMEFKDSTLVIALLIEMLVIQSATRIFYT